MKKVKIGVLFALSWLLLTNQRGMAQARQEYGYIVSTTLCGITIDLPNRAQSDEIHEFLARNYGVKIGGVNNNQIYQLFNNCKSSPQVYPLEPRVRFVRGTSLSISNGQLWLSCTESSAPENVREFYEEQTQDDPVSSRMPIALWLDRACGGRK